MIILNETLFFLTILWVFWGIFIYIWNVAAQADKLKLCRDYDAFVHTRSKVHRYEVIQ